MRTTRRQFLVVTAGAALLTACKDDGSESTPESTGTTTPATDAPPANGYGLVQRFPNAFLFTPGEVRLPVSLTDGVNLLTTGPATLTGWVETMAGERVAEVTAGRRDDGVANAYWDVRVTLDEAKIYTLRIDGDDGFGAAFEVFDPADISSPVTGAPMPPFDTPTVDDHRGVEPYCSLTPEPCPLHEVTLTEALASGTPVVYMVGTPAHCSTGTCAPGLEFLVEEHEARGDAVVMVHADVYADADGTEISPAVDALHVIYEPIIYLMDAEGVVVDRLDGVWDRSELRERLDLLLG